VDDVSKFEKRSWSFPRTRASDINGLSQHAKVDDISKFEKFVHSHIPLTPSLHVHYKPTKISCRLYIVGHHLHQTIFL
jgi:hypothetical protein